MGARGHCTMYSVTTPHCLIAIEDSGLEGLHGDFLNQGLLAGSLCSVWVEDGYIMMARVWTWE